MTAAALRLTFACVLGTTASVILAGTVMPPLRMWFIPASIGGTELAPWFLLIGGVVLGLACRRAPANRSAQRSAVVLGGVVIILALRTVVQVPSAIAQAEMVMIAAFGQSYVATCDRAQAVRPVPISMVDLVRGIPLPAITVETAIPMFTVAGETLHADIFHPLDAGPHPIVVAIHGGAWSSGSRSEGTTCHRALAASGFLVVSIDYRLAPKYRFPAQLDDVRAALAWVRQHAADYAGDPSRIALLGRSAGAQLALLAAYEKDSGIRAAIAFYSPVDLTEGYRNPSRPDPLDTRAVFRDFLGGSPDEVPELYRAGSPIEQVIRSQPPTLLINGGRDHLVYVRFADALAQRLQEQHTPVAVIDIPWSEHAFDAIPNGLGGQLSLYHVERFLWTALGQP